MLSCYVCKTSSMDVHETFWAETRPETHVSETRDFAVSETLAKTLKLSRVSGALTFRRDVFRDVWWNTCRQGRNFNDIVR